MVVVSARRGGSGGAVLDKVSPNHIPQAVVCLPTNHTIILRSISYMGVRGTSKHTKITKDTNWYGSVVGFDTMETMR